MGITVQLMDILLIPGLWLDGSAWIDVKLLAQVADG